jgi:hypothetical protein
VDHIDELAQAVREARRLFARRGKKGKGQLVYDPYQVRQILSAQFDEEIVNAALNRLRRERGKAEDTPKPTSTVQTETVSKPARTAQQQSHTKFRFYGIRGETPTTVGKMSPQQFWLNTVLSPDGPKGAIRRAVACAVNKFSKPDASPFRHPGQQTLADAAGVARSTVRRHLSGLYRTGWLNRKRIDDMHGTRGGFAYFLTIPPKKNRRSQ